MSDESFAAGGSAAAPDLDQGTSEKHLDGSSVIGIPFDHVDSDNFKDYGEVVGVNI